MVLLAHVDTAAEVATLLFIEELFFTASIRFACFRRESGFGIALPTLEVVILYGQICNKFLDILYFHLHFTIGIFFHPAVLQHLLLLIQYLPSSSSALAAGHVPRLPHCLAHDGREHVLVGPIFPFASVLVTLKVVFVGLSFTDFCGSGTGGQERLFSDSTPFSDFLLDHERGWVCSSQGCHAHR